VEKRYHSLNSQSGQAIVEYILILVAVVGIILGTVYQFNDSFRNWAQSYFGDYIACLLETGELPSIDGSPGDVGTCGQLLNKFTGQEGKPLLTGTDGSGNSSAGRGAATSEAAGGSGSGSSHLGFGGSSGSSSSTSGSGDKIHKTPTYTGSTATSNYGGDYGRLNRQLDTGVRYRLDNRYAFEDEHEQKQTARTPLASKTIADQSRSPARIRIRNKALATGPTADADSSFTIGSFLRFLVIAAIVIGLIIFLGGQVLQVSKSMD